MALQEPSALSITSDVLDHFEGRPVKTFTLVDFKTGIQVVLIEWGAGVQSLKWPDCHGNIADVVLGYDSSSEYSTNPNWFGVTVGRVAGRISGARFSVDGREVHVSANNATNSLHGGNVGLSRVLWSGAALPLEPNAVSVRFTHTSADGSDGYPGALDCSLVYTLLHDADGASSLRLDYEARAHAACPVALTHHACWNLAGVESGESIHEHRVRIDADRHFETAPAGFVPTSVPTGRLLPVDEPGDQMSDFRRPTRLRERLEAAPDGGYNHLYLLNEPHSLERPRIELLHPASGRQLELYTDQRSLQFYTGQYLGDTVGKRGFHYKRHSYICICDSAAVDSVNHSGDGFQDVILRPGSVYRMTSVFRFRTLCSTVK